MESYVGLAGWAFLPSFVTNVLQSIWYSYKYPVNSAAKPAPNTPKYRRHYNRIYCAVVLGYLAYTIAEVDRATPTNFYDLLDLNFHSFSQKQLKTNFRKASLMYHPDKVGQAGAEMFVQIRAAHEVLSDPVSKQAYDRFGTDIVTCTTCKTYRDHIMRGLSSFYTFYMGSGVVLVLMSVLGKGQFGRYWRFIVLFGMGALELAMITRSEPITFMSWILPHRVTFEQVAILHQIFISTFIAISQIGPILVPSKEQEKSNTKDLIDRLELLTALSNSESIGQLQSVFDVFRGDEECMSLLKRQMSLMALDAQLTQDQMLNETRSAVQRRLIQRKNTVPLYQQRKLVPPPTATLPTVGLPRTPLQFTSQTSSPSLFPSSFKDSISQKTFLPRAALRNSSDHGTNFQKLLFFKECFHKREFWDECAILDRMYYKNKSQHRQAGYFQRLCECRRIVSRIRELNIAGLMDELVKKFFSGNSLKTVTATKNQWDSIPYRSTVAFTMTRIIGAILLIKKMQIVLHETYGAFYQLMSKTQFMSFALIAIGLCSRLSLVSRAWMSELADCYVLLGEWVKSFPEEESLKGSIDYESQLPESIESVIATTTPDILETLIPLMPTQTAEQLLIEEADLGEIIQRVEPSSTPGVSLVTTQNQPRQGLSSLPKSKHNSDSNLDPDGIGATPEENSEPIYPSFKPKKAKAPEILPDLDHIFNEEKTQKVKNKKKLRKSPDLIPSGTSVVPQSSLGVMPNKKNKAGSATNFDDIFNFDRDASGRAGSCPSSPGESKTPVVLSKKSSKEKREIDDIFGAIKKPIKKPKIDDFGSRKKMK